MQRAERNIGQHIELFHVNFTNSVKPPAPKNSSIAAAGPKPYQTPAIMILSKKEVGSLLTVPSGVVREKYSAPS